MRFAEASSTEIFCFVNLLYWNKTTFNNSEQQQTKYLRVSIVLAEYRQYSMGTCSLNYMIEIDLLFRLDAAIKHANIYIVSLEPPIFHCIKYPIIFCSIQCHLIDMARCSYGDHGKSGEQKFKWCYVQSFLDDSNRRKATKRAVHSSTIGIFKFFCWFIACVVFESALRLWIRWQRMIKILRNSFWMCISTKWNTRLCSIIMQK